jgi:hypothetical protein
MSVLTLTSFLSVMMLLWLCLNCSPRLLAFLIVPTMLAGIRFTGEILQEEGFGPVWIQYHLGDVGMISGNMLWGLVLAIWRTLRKEGDRLV